MSSHASPKNPVVAAILGLMFGPFGVGFYLGSLKDGLICFGIQMAALMIPIPPLNVALCWAVAAIYGFVRASDR